MLFCKREESIKKKLFTNFQCDFQNIKYIKRTDATSSQYPSQPPVTTVGPSRDGTISEDTIQAFLISVVSDKLRWRVKGKWIAPRWCSML